MAGRRGRVFTEKQKEAWKQLKPFVKGVDPRRRDQRKPTAQQVAFANRMVQTGVASVAYREVYGDAGTNTGNRALKVLKNPKVQTLIASIEEKLAQEARGSIEKMAQLRDTAELEKTQLGAAKGLLDSYAAMMTRQMKAMEPTEGATTNILVTSMSDADILRRLEQLNRDQGTLPGTPPTEDEG